tara:strand:+ start:5780 stop:6646 length:867 start_codon:yes stop_codon:yes gene_type:complete
VLFNNFKDYLDIEKKYSKKTVYAYLGDIHEFDKFLKVNFSNLNIKNIEYTNVRRWIVKLSEKNISKNTINRKLASLKSYFNFLVATNTIDISPLESHKNLKTVRKIINPFTEQEINEVFENFELLDLKNKRDQLIIEILYSTGIRREELINIKISDIYFNQKLIKVLGKRNKERLVPMLPKLSHNIDLYIKNNDPDKFLFESKSQKKISISTLYRLVNKYFRVVSTKTKISPHVLRHTFATHMYNNGADINSIKEILGHASLSSTELYTKVKLPKIINDYKQNHPREK